MTFTARKKFFRGFTLIELLIVIAILGILAAAVLVAVNPGKRTRQAQDAKRKNDVGALATELQGYYTSPGAGCYPATLNVLVSDQYINTMPTDPTTGAVYTYSTGTAGTCASGGTTARLFATLAEPVSTAAPAFCWESTTGTAAEQAEAACLAP